MGRPKFGVKPTDEVDWIGNWHPDFGAMEERINEKRYKKADFNVKKHLEFHHLRSKKE